MGEGAEEKVQDLSDSFSRQGRINSDARATSSHALAGAGGGEGAPKIRRALSNGEQSVFSMSSL